MMMVVPVMTLQARERLLALQVEKEVVAEVHGAAAGQEGVQADVQKRQEHRGPLRHTAD